MEWVRNDGGRKASGFRGAVGDCFARAISIVTRRPYREVYDLVNEYAKGERFVRGKVGMAAAVGRGSSARNGVGNVTARRVAREYGLTWTPTMFVGSGCKVHLRADELPAGRLAVRVSKHYVAVLDGVMHDTFDPTDRGSTIYPVTHSAVPKGARLLDDGSAWVYAPDRCVYGYWAEA